MRWYVYGVVHATGAPVPPDLVGLGATAVTLVGTGDLRVVASAVPDTLDLARAPDEDVVAAVRRHDDVLRVVSRTHDLLPVRFGTVLVDATAVDDLLADTDGALHRALTHVADADEWVVTVMVASTTQPEAVSEQPHLTPGHAFFARRRSAGEQRQQSRERAIAAARDVDTHLQTLARDFRPLELRDRHTVARGAYLVPRGVTDQVTALTRTGDGVHIEVQGPLPPYRFAGATL